MGEGEDVLGLEPSNCYVEGRAKLRQDGTLEYIKPGEKRNFDIELRIIDGDEAINKQRKQFLVCLDFLMGTVFNTMDIKNNK